MKFGAYKTYESGKGYFLKKKFTNYDYDRIIEIKNELYYLKHTRIDELESKIKECYNNHSKMTAIFNTMFYPTSRENLVNDNNALIRKTLKEKQMLIKHLLCYISHEDYYNWLRN